MKVSASDRRSALRHNFKVPIRIRKGKSGLSDQRGESENLSERGIFFATNTVIPIGTMVEILLKMPEAITGEPTTEWLCSGHVVRVEPVDSPRGNVGVGVQFDCCPESRLISPNLGSATMENWWISASRKKMVRSGEAARKRAFAATKYPCRLPPSIGARSIP